MLISLILSALGVAGLLTVILALYPEELEIGYYPLLVVLGLLGGCGIVTFSPGIGQVSYWFPQERQGSALGVFAGVGNLAPGIFAFLLPVSLAGLGLGITYLAWLVFLILGTVLYYFIGVNACFFQLKGQCVESAEARKIALEHGQTSFPRGTATESLATAARIWKTWALVAIYFTSFGGFIALTAWFPTYWAQFYKVDLITAGLLTGIFSILTSIVRVGGGAFSDRLGGERTAVVSLLIMAAGSVIVTVSGIFALSVAGVLIMAVGMGVTNAAVFKIVPSAIKEAVGGAAGWIGGIGAFGGFAIPPAMALFVSWTGSGGYAFSFVTIVALTLVSLVLIYILRQTRTGLKATDEKAGKRLTAA